MTYPWYSPLHCLLDWHFYIYIKLFFLMIYIFSSSICIPYALCWTFKNEVRSCPKINELWKKNMNFYFIQSKEHFDKKIILLNCIATFHCHFSFNKKCVKYFLNSLHTKAMTIFKHNCSLCIQFTSPMLLAF